MGSYIRYKGRRYNDKEKLRNNEIHTKVQEFIDMYSNTKEYFASISIVVLVKSNEICQSKSRKYFYIDKTLFNFHILY